MFRLTHPNIVQMPRLVTILILKIHIFWWKVVFRWRWPFTDRGRTTMSCHVEEMNYEQWPLSPHVVLLGLFSTEEWRPQPPRGYHIERPLTWGWGQAWGHPRDVRYSKSLSIRFSTEATCDGDRILSTWGPNFEWNGNPHHQKWGLKKRTFSKLIETS